MRKGLLGSVAALAAGAGAAWAQPPAPVAPVPLSPSGPPVIAPGLPGVPTTAPNGAPLPPITSPAFGGIPPTAIPGNQGFAPQPLIMPPGNFGPAYDPLGQGPVGGFGPPPGPMYPVPGPYAQQSFQPAPPMPIVPGAGGPGGLGGPGGRDIGYGAAPRWWVDGECLLLFTSGQPIKFPLLTTSSPADAGVVGAPTTIVVAGNRDLGYGAISGFRVAAGFFGDADRRFGFQMTGFATEKATNDQTYGTLRNLSGIPVFARPFNNLDSSPNALVISGPNFGPATARVLATHETWGVEPAGVWNLYRAEPGSRANFSLNFLAGYRFIQLKEDVSVSSTTRLNSQVGFPTFLNNPPFGIVTQTGVTIIPAFGSLGGVNVGGPATVSIRDNFRVTNRFNGLMLGLETEGRYGMFTTSAFAKFALGYVHERVEINGVGSFFDPTQGSGGTIGNLAVFASGTGGGIGAAYGGVLANSSNIGTFSHDRFTCVSEAGVKVGIALTRGLTGYVGVNFLYFPDVVRPGTLINPNVSTVTIPFSANYGMPGGSRGPAVQFIQQDQVLGGATFGLMLRY